MKTQRLLLVLTVANLALLAFLLARTRAVEAADVVPVLRGRALEIVDDQGRVRAAIRVFPAGPARRADGSLSDASGKIYPETVLLRLIDPNGRPSVKLSTTEEGGGLGLGGATDPTYISLIAAGDSTSVTLTNKDGTQSVIKP